MSGRSLRVLVVATLCMSSVAMAPGLVIILAVQIRRDLAMTPVQLGLAVTIYSVAIAATSIAFGRLADRIGWPRTVLMSLTASILLLLAVAFLVQSFISLLPLMFLAGANVALSIPATGLALARELPAEHQGLTFGLKEASIPLTFLLGGLAIPAVALTIGWRWAFVLGTALPLLAAAVLLVDPSDLRRSPSTSTAGPEASEPEAKKVPKVFRLLAVAGGLAAASLAGISFAALSAVDAGLTEASTGLLIAAASVASIISRIGVGVVADRRHSGGFPEAATMLLIGALGYAFLITHTPLAAVVGTVIMYAFGWSFTGVMWQGAVAAHPQAPASATGVIQVGFGIGIAVGPLSFGAIVDVSGYSLAWATMTVLGVAAAATLYVGALKVRSGVTAGVDPN